MPVSNTRKTIPKNSNNPVIECVPNFSEGQNQAVIDQITATISGVEGVKLLHVDSGFAANRTVVSFAGHPEAVVEAAFQGIKKASELIDMQSHKGVHPRFGATDVCPLIPLQNIDLQETVEYARQLARRVGEKLQIPVYCYEAAAFNESRKSLVNCRAGGYEGLPLKLTQHDWQPDFGPATMNLRSGASAIGARNILIAYNVNLDSDSAKIANEIAAEVRESGRKSDNPTIRVPGKLKKVRAIGWYIEEYALAQVSMNLIDIKTTPVHIAFEEVCKSAASKGIQVTSSELIGLIPLQTMLDAGKYFLEKQGLSPNAPDKDLIELAIMTLGLNQLSPFLPEKRIIEYVLNARNF